MTTRIQPDELVRKELVLEEASQLKVYRESLFENAHLLLDADKCPSILGMCTFAALRDPHSLLQWRQSSAILQALQELSYLQPPKDYDPTPALVNELGLATRGFERQPDGGPTAESPPRGPLPRITTRELEVLRLLASGNRNKEIADQLSLSVRTIRFHIENLYRKLEVNCRTQATRVAFERGYLKPI